MQSQRKMSVVGVWISISGDIEIQKTSCGLRLGNFRCGQKMSCDQS